jgi:hypothetical protein
MTRRPKVVRLEYLPKLSISLLLSPRSMVYDSIQVMRYHHRHGSPILLLDILCAQFIRMVCQKSCQHQRGLGIGDNRPEVSIYHFGEDADDEGVLPEEQAYVRQKRPRSNVWVSQSQKSSCSNSCWSPQIHRISNPSSTSVGISTELPSWSDGCCWQKLVQLSKTTNSRRRKLTIGRETSQAQFCGQRWTKPASSVLSLVSSNWLMSTSSWWGPHKKERERGFRIGDKSPQVVILDV